jgi:hypothetical protein
MLMADESRQLLQDRPAQRFRIGAKAQRLTEPDERRQLGRTGASLRGFGRQLRCPNSESLVALRLSEPAVRQEHDCDDDACREVQQSSLTGDPRQRIALQPTRPEDHGREHNGAEDK